MHKLAALAALIPVLACAADGPPEDPQHFTTADMSSMAGKMARSLKKCKELAHGTVNVNFNFSNHTSEFIDKDSFVKAIQAELVPSAGGPGKAYDVKLTLFSTEKMTGNKYENSYRLEAQLQQGDEVLCRKKESVVKKGTR